MFTPLRSSSVSFHYFEENTFLRVHFSREICENNELPHNFARIFKVSRKGRKIRFGFLSFVQPLRIYASHALSFRIERNWLVTKLRRGNRIPSTKRNFHFAFLSRVRLSEAMPASRDHCLLPRKENVTKKQQRRTCRRSLKNVSSRGESFLCNEFGESDNKCVFRENLGIKIFYRYFQVRGLLFVNKYIARFNKI